MFHPIYNFQEYFKVISETGTAQKLQNYKT